MAIEDLIPLDALFSKKPKGKNKKVDKEAISSPIMRIPRMDVTVVRSLINIGIRELYELKGRSAESIFEEIIKIRPQTPPWTIPYLRMAVYFSEQENPEPGKMHPEYWKD